MHLWHPSEDRQPPAYTQPARTSLSLVSQSRSAPSPIPTQHLTVPSPAVHSSLSHLSPPPTVMAAEWVSLRPSLENRAPFPPGFCRTKGLGSAAHLQTCGVQGEAGGGVQNGCQDGWLSLRLSLSLSLPLSACPVLLAASGVIEETGLEGEDRCGVLRLRVDICSGPVDLSPPWGEAVDLCSPLQSQLPHPG